MVQTIFKVREVLTTATMAAGMNMAIIASVARKQAIILHSESLRKYTFYRKNIYNLYYSNSAISTSWPRKMAVIVPIMTRTGIPYPIM